MSMVNRETLNSATELELHEFLGKLTREAKMFKIRTRIIEQVRVMEWLKKEDQYRAYNITALKLS